ncbi:MAG TPA: sodium/proline symporter [Longimicrobiales bacterium]|nr:sodium/proline symporter [Longimicrobiales bacterium]
MPLLTHLPTPLQETTGTAPTLAVDAWAVGSFVAYLLVVVAIGVWSARRSSEGLSEFFLGGRRMNRFVVALSAVVSGRSSWLLLGVTGMAYTMGASAVWAVAGYTVVEAFLFLFYAPRLRRFSERYDAITVPDFFAERFADRGGLRIALAAVILVFMVAYVASQFVGGGKAIGASFGLSPATGILLTAGIVLGYTVLGGFIAVSLTDTVQAVFMLVALLVLPVLATVQFGGWGAVASALGTLDPGLPDPFAVAAGAGLGFVAIGLGSPGNPHILVRYMSIADPKQLRFAAVVGTVWNVLMGAGAVLIGMVGRAWIPDVAMLPQADPENIFPVLAQQHLPPILFGVVVAAIFAAIMSTADSQLLVAASTVVRDVYEKVLRAGRPLGRGAQALVSRAVVAALVAMALLLGWVADELVFWLVLFAWAGLGAALGPTSILALFWRRTTRAGIFAGLVAGTLTTFIWYWTPALKGAIYELIPAFAAGLLATVVVSLATKPPPDVDHMFDVMAGNNKE